MNAILGINLWIVLLVALQCSVVLCRSTNEPESGNEKVETSLSDNSNYTNGTGVMAHGTVYIDSYQRRLVESHQAAVKIVLILFAVFVIGSLITGCFLFFMCKSEPRTGMIVTSNQPGQPTVAVQPGIVPPQPGFVPAQPGFVPAQPGFVPSQRGFVPAQTGSVPQQNAYR